MNSLSESIRATAKPSPAKPPALPALRVEVASGKAARAFCTGALEAEHALGSGHVAGRRLWQIVRRVCDDEPVAVLLWAASAFHLRARDAWIGWDAMTRSRRLGLLVNNSRLLILEKHRAPNLATQVLGAALRALPSQWREAHAYTPLLAEAFTDLETHHGTSYKASNWLPLGLSKGFARHRADFYVPHERPKKRWVFPLQAEARTRLCAPVLAPEHAAAEIAPVVRSPLRVAQMQSLREVFMEMDDPRRIHSRRYALALMLTLLSMSLLCGARTLSDTVRCCQLLGQRERRALGLRLKKGTEIHRVPCYNAFRELLPMLDLGQMLRLLSQWLTQHEGTLPRTLAIDGKDLGGQLGLIVSLINTTRSARPEDPAIDSGNAHDGTPAPPVAMAVAPGKGHEQSAARELLARADVNLQGAIVTADALHAQHATLREIATGHGADYLVSLKDNQKSAHDYAAGILAGAAPLFAWKAKPTDALRGTKSGSSR